ncbi:MAG: DMT family transporter [Xenococcaceae cyanobacterium MO_188.B29]|nr:DMT family transporter [Xenococcaceae cyanobacterium MO_188.B29]
MRISDLLELLLLAAVWGASFLFMRIAAPVLGPVLLIELRVLLAGLALLLLSIRLNRIAEIRRQLLPLFVVGCINSAIPFLLFAFASLSLPAGFTAILNATAPLFGTAIASVWLGEKLTFSRFFGLVLGFAGVTVLVGWTNIPITQSFIWAVLAGLFASLMYAIAAPYTKQKLSKVSPIVIATGSQLSAAAVLLPITPFFLPTELPSVSVISVVLALAFLSTAFAYILYFRLISNIGAGRALTVAYLIPLFAMVWGAIVLSEVITLSMILGCGLILTGTAIAVYSS